MCCERRVCFSVLSRSFYWPCTQSPLRLNWTGTITHHEIKVHAWQLFALWEMYAVTPTICPCQFQHTVLLDFCPLFHFLISASCFSQSERLNCVSRCLSSRQIPIIAQISLILSNNHSLSPTTALFQSYSRRNCFLASRICRHVVKLRSTNRTRKRVYSIIRICMHCWN